MPLEQILFMQKSMQPTKGTVNGTYFGDKIIFFGINFFFSVIKF